MFGNLLFKFQDVLYKLISDKVELCDTNIHCVIAYDEACT